MEKLAHLKCEAVRWADDHFPGWIEVSMQDADGRTWRFVDKEPIFGSHEPITKDSPFPVPVTIRVTVIEDGDPMVVSTAPGVESDDGSQQFRVLRSTVDC